MRAGSARLVVAAFAALLAALLLFRAFDPWRYPNDDNGAWFSAVARSHLNAGLGATRGQDFFTARETGELVPYLHHPPLPGLMLAAVFKATGSDAPGTARLTFALLHLLTFALIARLALRLWNPAREGVLFSWVVAVAATAPMSSYYGKMPNHEVPGLLFFLLGVTAWGLPPGSSSPRRAVLACAAWTLAVFSSWHAVLCVLGWLAVQPGDPQRRVRPLAILWVVVATLAVATQLLWAGNWSLLETQTRSAGYWFAGSDGASLGARLGFLSHALGIGLNRFAQFPALLSLAWLLLLAVDCVRERRRPAGMERALLGLGLGSMVYYLLFPRAVSFHAYQGFYVIPFVALTSALALQRLRQAPFLAAHPRVAAALPAVVLGLTCVVGVGATLRMYRAPSPGVLETVGTLERQYR